MLLYVHTIRHNGLVLSAPNSAVGEFWLPGLAVDEAVASSWEEFRHAAVPGMVVSVAPAHGDASLGMDNLQVVTMRAPEAHQLCDVWKGEAVENADLRHDWGNRSRDGPERIHGLD